MTGHLNSSVSGCLFGRYHLHGRRFTGPVVAQETENFTGPDGERKGLNGRFDGFRFLRWFLAAGPVGTVRFGALVFLVQFVDEDDRLGLGR